jgi:hypothetical protein
LCLPAPAATIQTPCNRTISRCNCVAYPHQTYPLGL